MQARGATLAPGILFDADIGRDLDTTIALCMLCGLGRGRVIAIGVSNSSLDAAAMSDGIARFYGSAGNLPVGLAENGHKLESPHLVKAALDLRNADSQPTLRTVVRTLVDTGDPQVVFRNALLTQQDMQGIAVLAGPATNLARLLSLAGARDIVSSKVRLLVMAAGAFDGASPDPRIGIDIAAAKKILAEWPTPIVAVGVEAGKAAPYPNESLEADFSGASNHPLGAVYRAYRLGNSEPSIPAQSVLSALYATNSTANYFSVSQPGIIEISADGRTTLKPSSSGTHRHLIVDPTQKDAVTKAFISMATARPSAGRGGPARN